MAAVPLKQYIDGVMAPVLTALSTALQEIQQTVPDSGTVLIYDGADLTVATLSSDFVVNNGTISLSGSTSSSTAGLFLLEDGSGDILLESAAGYLTLEQ